MNLLPVVSKITNSAYYIIYQKFLKDLQMQYHYVYMIKEEKYCNVNSKEYKIIKERIKNENLK